MEWSEFTSGNIWGICTSTDKLVHRGQGSDGWVGIFCFSYLIERPSLDRLNFGAQITPPAVERDFCGLTLTFDVSCNLHLTRPIYCKCICNTFSIFFFRFLSFLSVSTNALLQMHCWPHGIICTDSFHLRSGNEPIWSTSPKHIIFCYYFLFHRQIMP